jgi:hypothetical protein
MARSFGIVEEKLREAEFFLHKFLETRSHSPEGKYYFSAFVSAARSITLAMQASLNGVDGFEEWYEKARLDLKADPLAPHFLEIRNDVVHTGDNPLNRVPLEHLREHMSRQFREKNRQHIIVMPSELDGETTLVDAGKASKDYFVSLIKVIFDCYQKFKSVVDARWYFTQENFISNGKKIQDALVEMGFPPTWLPSDMDETDAWRVIRSQQHPCLINDLFIKYLGSRIPDPDEA